MFRRDYINKGHIPKKIALSLISKKNGFYSLEIKHEIMAQKTILSVKIKIVLGWSLGDDIKFRDDKIITTISL